MPTTAATILAHLKTVNDERSRRAALPELAEKVVELKRYQQRRFSHTYADLLGDRRYSGAAHFFLDELYGPNDFTQRDAQFARVVPALVRLFPSEVVETVAALAHLHALSETLDTSMGAQLGTEPLAAMSYIVAWQATGRAAEREAQIALTLDVATRLDRFTRRTVLRNSLRLMRGPARAAGLTTLQRFLEAGFDTFRAMQGAEEFIGIVKARERILAKSLFEAAVSKPDDASVERALARLP